MNTTGTHERQDLFFQYLVFFVITCGVVLLALFFTRQNPDEMVSPEEKEAYRAFSDFDKAGPLLAHLADTVKDISGKMKNLNLAGIEMEQKNANGLIDDFETGSAVKPSNPFVEHFNALLRIYISKSVEIKSQEERIRDLDKQLEDCNEEKKDARINKALSNNSPSNGNP